MFSLKKNEINTSNLNSHIFSLAHYNAKYKHQYMFVYK